MIWLGDRISGGCTKQILCEQSCLDALNGQASFHYPEQQSNDLASTKEYIDAYNLGESVACYGQIGSNEKKNSKDDQVSLDKKCYKECQMAYPECDAEIDNSFVPKSWALIAYRWTARWFHMLGMWTFRYSQTL